MSLQQPLQQAFWAASVSLQFLAASFLSSALSLQKLLQQSLQQAFWAVGSLCVPCSKPLGRLCLLAAALAASLLGSFCVLATPCSMPFGQWAAAVSLRQSLQQAFGQPLCRSSGQLLCPCSSPVGQPLCPCSNLCSSPFWKPLCPCSSRSSQQSLQRASWAASLSLQQPCNS